jgi:protein gp37
MEKMTETLSIEQAEELAQGTGQVFDGSYRQMEIHRQLGVHRVLGFATFKQYVEERIGGYVKLSIEQRQQAIAELIDHGNSNVEIAEVLGVDETTVRSDIRGNPRLQDKKSSKNKGGSDSKSGKSPQPMLILRTHLGEHVPYPKPKGKPTFNETNEQISWAAWSWNPVTGCLHGCKYCYARELALKASYANAYPVGFTPLFHPQRLDAPANTNVPDEAETDPRKKRVFVCSMADLYGKWVPDEWIERVHASCIANPQWDYLMLTKFPRRYVGLSLPPTAWLGTSVDEQKRVHLAEDAFRQIKNVRVKWLSLEPLLAPLKFNDLSMFDWIVIGSQSATEQPDGHVAEFAPPLEWVGRLVAQARECGCKVYCKPNLLGIPNPQSPGMQLPQEEPLIHDKINAPLLALA